MHKKIWKTLSISLTVALVSAFFSGFIVIVSADPTTTVSIEPASIVDTTLVPGKSFVINATVTDVTDLYAWQVKVYFNPAILNYTAASYPSDHVFSTFAVIYPVTPTTDIDAQGTYVLHGCSLMTPPAGGGFTGSGTLCQINFTVLDTGSSLLEFSRPYGEDTLLEDSWGGIIAADLQDGYFSNKLPPPTAMVYVSPERKIDPSLVPCSNFTLDIAILNATDLYSFEFKLSFNQSVLNVVEAVLGDLFPPSVVPTVEINNLAGYVAFSASLSPPQSAVSGDGTLATIEFHVESEGITDLHLYDVQLQDQTAAPLPFETQDGFFSNLVRARLYVDPPEIIDPELLPPATVDVNVTIDDVENMYGYEFKLGYDTDMLICIRATIHPILGEINYIPNINIDNFGGVVWINVTYYAPAVPITTYSPEALATLTFRIKSGGSSVLDLHDTNVIDQAGQPIPHDVGDGLIVTLIRDVAILDVTVSPSLVYQGWTVNVTVVAKNEGNISETFDVDIYYGATVVGTEKVEDLASNAETTFTFIWDTQTATPCSNLTVSAEAVPLPDEMDTTDNAFTDGYLEIRLMGDVDGNGKVDIRDLSAAGRAFGSYPGDPRWDSYADLNGDGEINIRDLAAAARNFGKTC